MNLTLPNRLAVRCSPALSPAGRLRAGLGSFPPIGQTSYVALGRFPTPLATSWGAGARPAVIKSVLRAVWCPVTTFKIAILKSVGLNPEVAHA